MKLRYLRFSLISSELSFRVLHAEREGFEPPVPLGTAVFKTAVIDHSTISPVARYEIMTIEIKHFALNLQGFESCTEVRGSNVMQKYYFISLLPNFWATFSAFPSNFVVFRCFTYCFERKLPNGTTRKAEMVQYLGSGLRRELALQGNKLQAVDIEQGDVTPFNDNEPFFDKLGEGANGIGSAHVAECSQFATCEMR